MTDTAARLTCGSMPGFGTNPEPSMRGVDQQRVPIRRAPPPPPRSCRRRRSGSPPPPAAAVAPTAPPPATAPPGRWTRRRPSRRSAGSAGPARRGQGRPARAAPARSGDQPEHGCSPSVLPQPPRLPRPASIPPRLGEDVPQAPPLFFWVGTCRAAPPNPQKAKVGFGEEMPFPPQPCLPSRGPAAPPPAPR